MFLSKTRSLGALLTASVRSVEALRRTANALRHLPLELWEAPELMLEAVRGNPMCMSTLPWFQELDLLSCCLVD